MNWNQANFQTLEAVFQRAKELRKPIPWELVDRTVLVHATGMGAGSQSRMRYQVESGGILIGLTDRHSSGRRHANFQLLAKGEACLMVGLAGILEFQESLIRELGGELTDSWGKRMDLCFDVPGVSIHNDLYPAFKERRFITSSVKWSTYDGPQGVTGFSIKSNDLTLNIYDKLQQIQHKGEDYRAAMLQHRWNNTWPKSAIRIEFQIRKPWLDKHSILTAPEMLSQRRDIITKLLSKGPRPFVRFTNTLPDRENGHQDRVKTLPFWDWITKVFPSGFPDGIKPLVRLNRDNLTGLSDARMLLGCVTKAAAKLDIAIHSQSDAVLFFQELLARASLTDEKCFGTWSQHAIKLGTNDTARQVGSFKHDR